MRGSFSFFLQCSQCVMCFLYAIASWARCVYSTSNFQLIALQHWTHFGRFLRSSHAVVCNNHAPRQCCADVDRTRAMLRKCFLRLCDTKRPVLATFGIISRSHHAARRKILSRLLWYFKCHCIVSSCAFFAFPSLRSCAPFFFWFSHPQTSSLWGCRLCENFTVAIAALKIVPSSSSSRDTLNWSVLILN